jgi:hypothetical protein
MNEIAVLSRTQRVVVDSSESVNSPSRQQRIVVDADGGVTVVSKHQSLVIEPVYGITIVQAGPPGPRGFPGEQGEAGEPGISGGAAPFHFEQTDPESVWIIDHNRDTTEYAITLRDQDGILFIASHSPVNENRVAVSLSFPMTGSADLVF